MTRRDFAAAAAELLTWQVHRRAGMRVPAGTPAAAPGVELRARFGPVPVPCRVVYSMDGPDVRGFAYGTLPGHPERGEERFELRRAPDGVLTFTVTAFSVPASVLARLSGPVGHIVQDVMTARYLRALESTARSG